jgi:poly [ADP-ribose] polymerase
MLFQSNQGNFSGDSFFSKVNSYLSLIPQEGLVRKMNFEEMFGSSGLQKQIDILDGLETSYTSALSIPKQTDQKNGDNKSMFKVILDRVNSKLEFDKIRDLYHKTKGGHRDVASYDVYTVYSLKIEAMANAFEKNGKKIGNIKRLWHGTKASNVLSILKSGMIIPRSSGTIQITGRLYSDGLYFSDQSTKAIRYATGAWGGSGAMDRKFMFLADVAMGKSYTPTGSYNFKMPKGYDSCFAKANVSGVLNNEMIVYNTSQANPVYIIEFTQ